MVAGSVAGQLAITEVMSSASTNNLLGVPQGPDFWELSNFGTNAIDLTGFRWNDNSGGLAGADQSPFVGLTIGPGEVILFVQDNVVGISTPNEFRAWWGLPPEQKVVFYTGNGLSSDGDSVILWGPDATGDDDYIERVDFGPATRRHTFAYNPEDGSFGTVSTEGVSGAFRAAWSDDVGSPGIHTGPVHVSITVHPTNQLAYAGFPVSFHAAARGLPRPRYQWLFNGVPIPEATAATFLISKVQPSDAGVYSVLVSNGLTNVLSSNAVLTVDNAPTAPTVVSTPTNIDAYIGQTVRLAASAQGNPAPSYQWYSNGVALIGQTGPQLILYNAETNFTAIYSVAAWNIVGTNVASAQVTVTHKPRFLITEVHSTGSSEFQDWWELTSFDSRPFNLKGYRFDDDSQSLSAAIIITNDVVIHPGESIVLVETTSARPMDPARFRHWWGTDNLPPHVKVVVYSGSGIGLSSTGDALYLWNAAATANSDFICGVTFGAAPASPRRTFVYNVDLPGQQTPLPGLLILVSTQGVNGAWVASNGDIGSPARVIEPVLLQIIYQPNSTILRWRTVPGRGYTLEAKPKLEDGAWAPIANVVAEGDHTIVNRQIDSPTGFFRVGTMLPFPVP